VKRTKPTFALLFDGLVGPYQVALLRAVEYASAARGVGLITVAGRSLQASNVGDATQTHVYDLIASNNVDGIILASGTISHAVGATGLAEFCKRYRPLPVCSIGVALPGIPSLIVSNRRGTQSVVEHLIVSHGAKRLAYIGGPETNAEARERYDGFVAALERHGLQADNALLVRGDFTMPSGAAAARELIARGIPFDALVGANDYMAIAAIDVLLECGRSVPRDVMVAGFDDAELARFSMPPLTTVRQPLETLGRTAVDWLLRAVDGTQLPDTLEVEVDMIARPSCGCGTYHAKRLDSIPPTNSIIDITKLLARDRHTLCGILESNISVPPDALGGWAHRILDALQVDLSGRQGWFVSELTSLFTEGLQQPDFVDELVNTIGILRGEIHAYRPTREVELDLEQTWRLAQMAAHNAAMNVQGRQRIDLQVVIDTVRSGFELITTALSRSALKQAIGAILPDVHIHRAVVCLVDDRDARYLEPLIVVTPEHASERATSTLPTAGARFPEIQLVPSGFFPNSRHSHIVLPLSFEQDWFGLIVMEHTTNESVYGLLRDNISSALKTGSLHQAAIRQTELLERAERAQLEQEAKIAARIQTAIVPGSVVVEGLQISAQMLPAVEVGGDYYEIIPFEGGCWLGIGDVTGHGLLAGLIMLMMQGMVSSLIARDPKSSPADLILALNRALYRNIRERLSLDDHATIALIRYENGGCLTFAGAHDAFIVYRARAKKCEIVTPPGFWVGAVPDISQMTEDATLLLSDGDILVLYTDGVTEALNGHTQQFGLGRLCRLVESLSAFDVASISRSILDAVSKWQSRQTDDITLVVCRYQHP
jgi:DNA-binding LacI/PurR family transcriptional regulator/serine phosphatase RsbU (regulator of sigma subunit)